MVGIAFVVFVGDHDGGWRASVEELGKVEFGQADGVEDEQSVWGADGVGREFNAVGRGVGRPTEEVGVQDLQAGGFHAGGGGCEVGGVEGKDICR
jgi:hypothetical protein